MDILSFNLGCRLKRLQHTSKTLNKQALKLYLALDKTQEEIGCKEITRIEIDLKFIKPNSCSQEKMIEFLDSAEESLLNVALIVIDHMAIPKKKI